MSVLNQDKKERSDVTYDTIKTLLTNSGIDSIYLMLAKIMAANHG
jgi:hypothetical protein